jgi:Tol biopolymer transport system component
VPWLALVVLVPVVAAAAWWIGSRPGPVVPEPVRTFELVPDGEPDDVTISPDGSRLAYVMDGKVFLRALDALEPRELTEQGSREIFELFWSPDGQSLGIVRGEGSLERVDLDGGAPITLASEDLLAAWPAWGEDGYIYYARFQGGIERIPESGGAPENVIPPRAEILDYHGMTMLPGGRGFLTVPHVEDGEIRQVVLERPGTEPVVVFESDSGIGNPKYSTSGHVLFFREESPRGLWAVPFSVDSLTVDGAPFLVVPDLGEASLSDRGDLVYTKAALQRGKQKQELIWVDRDGEKVGGLDVILYGAVAPVMSPDGKRIAVPARGVGRPSTGKPNLWVIDVERGSATRLTESGVAQSQPIWSEDGKRIAVLRDVRGVGADNRLMVIRADGSGEPETLLEADIAFMATLSRDWSWAAFITGAFGDPNGMSIVRRRVDDPETLTTVFDSPEQDVMPAIHPDGDWIAYASGPIAAFDTYVQRFPDGEGRYKVSVDRGGVPVWSPDGTRLYVVPTNPSNQPAALLEVTFDASGPRPRLGTPTPLFHLEDWSRWLSMTPDGHFMILAEVEPEEGEEAPDTTGIVLVQNWLSRFGG